MLNADPESLYRQWKRRNPQLALLEASLSKLLASTGAQHAVPPGKSDEVSAPWQRFTIYDDGLSPYLTRAYLSHENRQEWPGVFLHHFHRSDSDRELHNHPWNSAVSLVLTGGYVEHRMEGIGDVPRARYVAPFTVNHLGADTYHRVVLATDHCWSLFIVGQRKAPETEERAGWGFVDLGTLRYEDARVRAKRLGQTW